MSEPKKAEKPFVPTQSHAQFEELAQSCETYRYIGICHGRPGVGKTRSAQEFAAWPGMAGYHISKPVSDELKQQIQACQAIFYTATVANTPKTVQEGLDTKIYWFGHARLRFENKHTEQYCLQESKYHCPLVIVDEADRLSMKSFEQLRDLYDRCHFGLVLLGMPGLEKRLARYPQFYSRIGFVHEFKPLSEDEMRFIFERHWETLGVHFNPDRFNDVEAMNAIIQITRGNFRLIDRLFVQIKRIMSINNIQEPSLDVVQTARDCLVIGPDT